MTGRGKGGAVAAGHPATAAAAEEVLGNGGNAFDAVLAALAAATVAEPVLASLGGGGFLMAAPAGGKPGLYDFFAHTPRRPRPASDVDFFPITADFGTTTQEFHIGLGSIATPGLPVGIWEVHQDLGYMPLSEILAPAIRLARQGVTINALQAYILQIVHPIYVCRDDCRQLFASPLEAGQLVGEGDLFRNPDLGDLLDAFAHEGVDLFRRGEVAQRLASDCQQLGGHLTEDDLRGYRVARREPLMLEHAGRRIATNPPPSTGGLLIAFALSLLDGGGLGGLSFGSPQHVKRLVDAMVMTNKARIDAALDDEGAEQAAIKMLDPHFIAAYRDQVLDRPATARGTTHISVIDAKGNAAALTVSNGEGSGYVVPGTGVVMNNMLGEEDINPHGFSGWPTGTRMASMMAPTLVQARDGGVVALGSGGSNRIRTAILQVLLNLLDLGLDLEAAVCAPRVHAERGRLSVEPGLANAAIDPLVGDFDEVQRWEQQNLFFGGVHAVEREAKGAMRGVGDPRRGGVALVL